MDRGELCCWCPSIVWVISNCRGAQGEGSEIGGRTLKSHPDVKFVLDNAPRLIKVIGTTAISHSLWDGANRALLKHREQTYHHQIAVGYCGDCSLIVVSRLALLLDSDTKMVSLQSIYFRLKSDATVRRLIECLKDDSLMPEKTAEDAEYSIRRFLKVYRSLDWKDLHGRLVHFRNRGVAHLTPEKIGKRVTYRELRSLVIACIKMGECLTAFCKNEVCFREDELKEWSDQAFLVWDTALA